MRAILTYHSVDETGSVISIDERTFRRHVAWLSSGRIRVVPLDQLADVPSDEDAIAITFDDGLANFGEIAAPLLLAHGLPATLFVVSDAVGASNVWPGGGDAGIPVMRLLDWHELGRLAESGIALGAHTCTHPRLERLSAERVEREIVDSKSRLASELGIQTTTFAYPYGSIGSAARDVVARTFRCGVTTRLSMLAPSDDMALLPRLDSYYLRAPGTLEAWGSPRFRIRMGLLAGARNLRRTLARSMT
ncbi:MAG: polysaccharide deacetylase family protein [Gemmatimonadaceae bacterium]